ncbi:36545_t:CDS:2, partial [Racocetra persica]
NTNNFYENDNIELVISFDVELFSLITTILDENKENFNNNENFTLKLLIVQQNLLKMEMVKYQIKHPNPEVHRDTPIQIEQYNCEAVIKIEILESLNIIKIEYSYLMLHLHPIHVEMTLEI